MAGIEPRVHVQMRSLKKTGLDNSNINSGVLGEKHT